MEKHREQCKRLFEEALIAEDVYFQIDKVEIFDNEFDGNDSESITFSTNDKININSTFVRLSIFTQSMLEYDYSFLGDTDSRPGNRSLDSYRPYFFSYIANIDNNKAEYYNELIGHYGRARFTETEFNNENTLNGFIETSASPIKYIKRRLFILDKNLPSTEVDSINNIVDKSYPVPQVNENLSIQKFSETLKDVDFKNAFIYKVGNANFIQITGQPEFNLVFDAGLTIASNHVNYSSAKRAIKQLRPNIVIISHWDSDHYCGVSYADSAFFEVPWIAPEILKDTSINARRLVRYLEVKGNLYLIHRASSLQHLKEVICISGVQNGSVSLRRGNGVGSVSKINKEGLALLFDIMNTITLFHADIPYTALPETWDMIDDEFLAYFVIPHHGAKTNTKPLKNFNFCKTRAIISADGRTNRPNREHEDALVKNNCSIHITEHANKCLEIDLEKSKVVKYI